VENLKTKASVVLTITAIGHTPWVTPRNSDHPTPLADLSQTNSSSTTSPTPTLNGETQELDSVDMVVMKASSAENPGCPLTAERGTLPCKDARIWMTELTARYTTHNNT